MHRSFSLLALILLAGMLGGGFATPASAAKAGDATLRLGAYAPAFRLQDQHGQWVTPWRFRGHYLAMYFYPKDFTGGCTTEACRFRDDILALRKAGARVIGVSLDDVKSHAAFAAKYQVPFPLLADGDHIVATAYGVLTSSDDGVDYAKRTTFLIDPQGRIAKIYADVDPEKNAGQILADLTVLKALP